MGRGWAGQGMGLGARAVGGHGGPSWPGPVLCPVPRGCAGHPPGIKLRAGLPRWHVGARNSFPFMICYDDTPEG